jgi:hypothetical protein
MQERYDPKSGDIFLWITQKEYDEANTDGRGYFVGRIVSRKKCVTFSVSRSTLPNHEHIQVVPQLNEGGNKIWTNFIIEISNDAWKELQERKFTASRYTLTTGGQKITIFTGSIESEGYDALPK